MYKRLSSLVITGSLILTLTACTGSGQPEESVVPSINPNPNSVSELVPEPGAKLTVWDSFEEKGFIETVATKFEEQYAVKVRFAELNPNKAMEQIAIEAPVGVGADIFASSQDHMETAIKAKLLRPVDLHKQLINKEIDSKAVKGATYNGKLYGFPATYNVPAIFYNKDLIESAPTTWNGIIDYAQSLDIQSLRYYALMWNVESPSINYGFFGGYGAKLYGSKGTTVSAIPFNNLNSIKAGNFYRSLRDSVLPLRTDQLTEKAKQDAFINKQAAMVIGDTSNVFYFRAKLPNLATAPLPKLPNGEAMEPFSSVKSYYINANTEFPNAARMFAAYLTNAENQKLNFEMTGSIPTNLSVLQSNAVQSNPLAYGFLKQLKDSQPTPAIDEMDAYWAPMANALRSMWNNQMDASQAMPIAVTAMKKIIAEKK